MSRFKYVVLKVRILNIFERFYDTKNKKKLLKMGNSEIKKLCSVTDVVIKIEIRDGLDGK